MNNMDGFIGMNKESDLMYALRKKDYLFAILRLHTQDPHLQIIDDFNHDFVFEESPSFGQEPWSVEFENIQLPKLVITPDTLIKFR